jgi:hypothetical protein
MAAVQRVGSCTELPIFTVMGDWERRNVDGDTVLAVPFPGTEGTFVYTADAFAVPETDTPARSDESAEHWFELMTDPLIQQRYSELKGSLPLVTERGTVATEEELFGDQRPVPGLPAFVPAETFNALEDTLLSTIHVSMADAAMGAPDAARRQMRRASLVSYVQQEYCTTTGLCERAPAPERLLEGCEPLPAASEVYPVSCLLPFVPPQTNIVSAGEQLGSDPAPLSSGKPPAPPR